ncbi:MAG: hypothetical protein AAF465_14695 [Pseudomonadota bacterium]
MKLDIITIWAMVATATALVLTGVVITQSSEINRLTTSSIAHPGPSNTEPGAEASRDHYQAPAWLQGRSKEWRSAVDDDRRGYAVLFDYDRRQLLVERCVQPDVFDIKKNLPAEDSTFHCDRVLTSALQEFTESGVKATRKNGPPLTINIVPEERDGSLVLAMRFDQHTMRLTPGALNDLLQDMLRDEEFARQQQELLSFTEQKFKQQRALLADQSRPNGPATIIPRSLIKENEEEARLADHSTNY